MADALVPLRKRGVPRVSLSPFGLGFRKPTHFREMLRIAWDNRDSLGYAYRVLTEGVCDGCALGTTGLRDWTLSGTHLCLVRLNLLRLNTVGPASDDSFGHAESLRALDARGLRDLGRLAHPLRRRRGEPGFTRVGWDEAIAEIGARLRDTAPERAALFMTARGITNEVYYAAQKAWRSLGSPHIDNAARLCHSPSTSAMRRTLGVTASTCSYSDWYGTDLIVFLGSNPANDQPVAMKYLHEARSLGTRVVAVNTFEEPGLKHYWVPSTPSSALFGSELCDAFFHVDTGGDLAFLQAVQRLLLERGQLDDAFIAAHTEGFDALKGGLLALDLDACIAQSGATRDAIERFAALLSGAKSAVFVWSMGLTQHVHGSDTVAALCTLALMRGYVGREKCGLMPIRGHSGVQGGAEMGAYADAFPGGMPISASEAARLAGHWGFCPPDRNGMSTAEMLEAALRGDLDAFYVLGGNLRDTMPDPARVERALARVPLRIHQDIVLTHPMLVPPEDTVFILPARTRYEHRGGVTETTTERRVVFSPFVEGHECGEAREEWWIVLAIARAALGADGPALGCESAAEIRAEIDAVIPKYRGIAALQKQGDQFQWGGPRLCEGGKFRTPSGRARLELRPLPARALAPGELWMSTRRGKQFNSIVQADVDKLTGAARDHVLMHPEDMRALGLSQDAPLLLSSAHGQLRGRAFAADITRGNVQTHWPESNVLLSPHLHDAAAHTPDFNARVRVEAAR
jgi:molybdopterin-dependent oxidoreductase alpha subunit